MRGCCRCCRIQRLGRGWGRGARLLSDGTGEYQPDEVEVRSEGDLQSELEASEPAWRGRRISI